MPKDKIGSQAIKKYDRMLWNCYIFSPGLGAVKYIKYKYTI
jgi:hypothetical protein